LLKQENDILKQKVSKLTEKISLMDKKREEESRKFDEGMQLRESELEDLKRELEEKQLEWESEKQQYETELARIYNSKSENAKDREILDLRRKLNELKSNEKMLKVQLKKANESLELERKKSNIPHRNFVARNDSPWKNPQSRSGSSRSTASLDRSASGSYKSRSNKKPAQNPRAPTPKKSRTGVDPRVPRLHNSNTFNSRKEPSDIGRESNNSQVSSSKLSYESSKSNSKFAKRPASPGFQQKRQTGGLKSRSVSQDKRRQTPGKTTNHTYTTDGRREDSVEMRRNRMLKRKIREDEPVIATKAKKPAGRSSLG